MSFVVKNTTHCGVIDLICPHSCRGCGALGSVICEKCKRCKIYNNKLELSQDELELGELEHLYVVGMREGVLHKLVSEFKYKSVRACGAVLAEFLDMVLADEFDEKAVQKEVIVVPLPTIGRHIRERGLDHTLILAKKLVTIRQRRTKTVNWQVRQVLRRKVDSVQVGTKAKEREQQAAKAYEACGKVDPNAVYLLVDDVWTTGSTMRAAAAVLKAAGAKRVMGAVLEIGK